MARTVTIDDAVLEGLIANEAAVARLPHLLGALARTRAKLPKGTCRRCLAENRATMAAAYSRARQAIASLSPSDREALKGLLNAGAITVHVTGPGGRVTAVAL